MMQYQPRTQAQITKNRHTTVFLYRSVAKLSERAGVLGEDQGEGREGVETPIHRASPSVMRASRGVRRSNCKQIWLRVHDPSEGTLKLLLYKILLV
jgi:hypothetical protein